MRRLLATLQKELLLLVRDKSGLLLLFVMPAVLVLVVCLVQEKVLNPVTRILILDNDGGRIGNAVSEGITGADNIIAVMGKDIGCTTSSQAKKRVNTGEFQFSIVIPPGSTEYAATRAEQLGLEEESSGQGFDKNIVVFFDPSVQGGFRAAVLSAVSKVVLCMEYRIKLEQTLAMVGVDVDTKGPMPPPWFGIEEIFATEFGFVTMPTSVQQNVPAWALFGVFFICVPLSGSLIRERDNKSLDRLRTMPVPGFTLIAGKILAYIGVCMVQFLMVFLIGTFILPLLGPPAFSLGNHLAAVLVILVATALAATNYGIMLGTLAGSHEQAVVLGPISIVIAAALGGIIVPVYLMPEPMQLLSNLSPLAWALDAFYDIFLRGMELEAVLPEAGCLVLFSMITLGIAQLGLKYKK